MTNPTICRNCKHVLGIDVCDARCGKRRTSYVYDTHHDYERCDLVNVAGVCGMYERREAHHA